MRPKGSTKIGKSAQKKWGQFLLSPIYHDVTQTMKYLALHEGESARHEINAAFAGFNPTTLTPSLS